MTGAHLGGRGAGRRRSCSRDRRPPRRRQASRPCVMGATTHGHSAAFFHQILIDASEALSVTKIMLMDHPHRF